MIAFWVRSKFRVIGPRRHCICVSLSIVLVTMSLAAPVSLLSYQLRRSISSYPACWWRSYALRAESRPCTNTHFGVHPSTILIDVTIVAHNSRAADHAFPIDVLPRLAILPKLYHMTATIVLPWWCAASLLLSRNIWLHSSHGDFLKRILASSNIAHLRCSSIISCSFHLRRSWIPQSWWPTATHFPFLICSPPGPTFLCLNPPS
jgi:hypothetical protein